MLDQDPVRRPKHSCSPSTLLLGIVLVVNCLFISSSADNSDRRAAGADSPPTFKAGNGEYCPDDHWEENKIPYDESNPSNYARIDTSAGGLCSAFAAADKFAANLKLEGCWPKDKVYKRGASVLDLELQAYLSDTKSNPEKRSIKNFLKVRGRDVDVYVNVAKNKGVCPEAALLSEFHSDGNIDSMANVINDLESQLKKGATADTSSEVEFCPACQRVSPTMSRQDQKELLDVVRKSDRTDAAFFDAFVQIDEKACKNKRVKLSKHYALNPVIPDNGDETTISNLKMSAIDEHLKSGQVAYLRMDAADIYRLAPAGSAHAVVIVGAVDAIKIRGGDGNLIPPNKIGCYYALKTAWGEGLCEKKNVVGTVENPDVVCAAKTGIYFVSKKYLKEEMIRKNDATPFVSSGLDLSDPRANPKKCER